MTSTSTPTQVATTAQGEEHHGQRRVVVGVDGSAGGAAALAWALEHAQVVGASLDVVGTWLLPAVQGAAGYGAFVDPSAFDLGGTTADALDAAIASAVDALPGGKAVAVRPRVVEGHPARALLEAAEGADLLVVGSRGHGELSGMLLGSVGLHCVSHAHCPVVVVRQPVAAA